MAVWRGRKRCPEKHRARRNRNRPPVRTVPGYVHKPFVQEGTADRAWPSRRERKMVHAWDNAGTTGDILRWNRDTCRSTLHKLARKSGVHVHDGPARHDIRPIEPSVQHRTCTRAEKAFDKQLARERRD